MKSDSTKRKAKRKRKTIPPVAKIPIRRFRSHLLWATDFGYASLTIREKQVVKLRSDGVGLAEIAKILGISRVRVSQIQSHALAKLSPLRIE